MNKMCWILDYNDGNPVDRRKALNYGVSVAVYQLANGKWQCDYQEQNGDVEGYELDTHKEAIAEANTLLDDMIVDCFREELKNER